MEAEVLLATISGSAGVVSAVIAWLQTVRANRLRANVDIALEAIKSETALALESIKIENERRRKAFELASQACAPIETALDQAWQDMQVIKEVIAKLLSPIRYDKDIALKSLQPAVLSIASGYSQCGASIPEAARNAWHNAKHCAGVIELTVTAQENVSSLSDPVIELLKSYRNDLTDQQIALVGAREGIRGVLIERFIHLI